MPRLGPELIGAVDRPGGLAALRDSGDIHFVKTHRRLDADVAAVDRAVCLVRDGRDALVSWARIGVRARPVSLRGRAAIQDPQRLQHRHLEAMTLLGYDPRPL